MSDGDDTSVKGEDEGVRAVREIVAAAQEPTTQIVTDLGEVIVDSVLTDGLLKDIPLVATLVGIAKGTLRFRDRLLLSKVEDFLRASPRITPEKRERFLSKFQNDPSYRKRIVSNLVLALDRLDDMEKSSMLAKVFSAYVLERISYQEMRRLTAVLDRALVSDLLALRDGVRSDTLSLDLDVFYGLEGIGLASVTHSIVRPHLPGEIHGTASELNIVLSPLAAQFVEVVFEE